VVKRALTPLLALLLTASFSSAISAQDPPPPKPEPVQPAAVRALFVANCAQCHGEKGDGEGVTQLDRKARSFQGGGFSYGNTQDAILRSITHGIPGTPMPSFEKALDEAQRTALAQYVIAFGPEQIVVDPSESEMVVKDRPLVVRGKLPPIVAGAQEWPRGIAIGTPDGLTFEYRADDVHLLAVRAGRFVNRTDWSDRGGSALELLGKPIWNDVAHECFTRVGLTRSEDVPADDGGVELRHGLPKDVVLGPKLEDRHYKLIATEVSPSGAIVEYEMTTVDGRESARVRESCAAFRCALGSGFVVRSDVSTKQGGLDAAVANVVDVAHSAWIGRCAFVQPPGDHTVLFVARGPRAGKTKAGKIGSRLFVSLEPGRETRVELFVLTSLTGPLRFDDPALLARLAQEFDA
jgi:mono/diheme cytochrome c family protein